MRLRQSEPIVAWADATRASPYVIRFELFAREHFPEVLDAKRAGPGAGHHAHLSRRL